MYKHIIKRYILEVLAWAAIAALSFAIGMAANSVWAGVGFFALIMVVWTAFQPINPKR